MQAEASKFCDIYGGHPTDVLDRYLACAGFYVADIIIRITGDCPLISPELCGAVLSALKRYEADYASNIEPRTFPKGLDCEAFTMEALKVADRLTFGGEREHVTPWLRRANMKRVNVASPWPIEGRLTLDTEDDYRNLCVHFGHAPYERVRPPQQD